MNSDIFYKATGLLLNLLYPPTCIACKIPLAGHSDNHLCSSCYAELKRLEENTCKFCGSIIGEYARRRKECDNCCNTERSYTRVIGAVEYNITAKKIVHAFKFYNKKKLTEVLAREMLLKIHKEYTNTNFDSVIPVPLHKKKLSFRGYNQSALLAQYIAMQLNNTYTKNLLIRTRNTQPQSLLDSHSRETNLINAFTVNKEIKGKTILLIDDVLTTGCTASECARALRAAGARRIYVAVFAR